MNLSTISPQKKLKYAMAIHVAFAIVLVPVTAQTIDLLGLTGGPAAWVRWGFSPFYNSKFGFIVTIIGVGAQGVRYCFESLGFSGVAAQNIGWKLPLVASNLLSAGLLFKIGSKFGHRRPHIPALIWLLSPISIWVAAGHGQLEPLTVVTILGALWLMLDDRFVWSGIVTGIGVGIEYVPILVAIALFVIFITRNLRFKPLVSFGVAFVITVAGNFLPFFTWARSSSTLVSGLHSSYTVTTTKATGLSAAANPSIWSFAPGKGPLLWIPLYLILAICMLGMGVFVARRNRSRAAAAGVAVAAVFLIGLPLMDPGTLPQFTDLSLAGLCVLATISSVPYALIILAPIFGLASGLLHVYGGNLDSFWYDMWRTTGKPGWLPPESIRAAVISGRISAVLTTVTLIYFLWSLYHEVHENSGSSRTLKLALGCSTLLAGALVFWALQPGYWTRVIATHPSELPGYHQMIQEISGKLSLIKGAENIVFPVDLVNAANAAVVRPELTLLFSVRSLVNPGGVGQPIPISNKYHLDVNIKNWPRESRSVQSTWVSLLFGIPKFSKSQFGTFRAPDLLIKGARLKSAETHCVTFGWCVGTYVVPANYISTNGILSISFSIPSRGTQLSINANDAGPWMQVFPRSGYMTLASSHATLRHSFESTIGNQSELMVDYQKGLVSPLHVSVDGTPLPGVTITGGLARWPSSPNILPTWLNYFGLSLSFLALIALVSFDVVMTGRLILRTGNSSFL